MGTAVVMQHNRLCGCQVCETVRSLLVLGGDDRWVAAVHLAFDHGLIDAAHVEMAFAAGIDVLELVGF